MLNMEEAKNNTILTSKDNISCMERISTVSDHLSVKRLYDILGKLIEQGRDNYKVNLCGAEEYYMYLIDELNLVSFDTNPDEFDEYFNEDE